MATVSVEMVATKTKRRRIPGAHLRAARDAVGLSQEEIAVKLDVRVATISERENAATVPYETWIAWSTVLGLALEWKPGEQAAKRQRSH